MICPNCKTENQDNAKFCRNCGHEISAESKIKYIPSTSFKASKIVQGLPFKNYRYYKKELFKQFSWIEEKEYPKFVWWKYDLSWNFLFIKKNNCIGLFDVANLRVAIPPIYKTVEYFIIPLNKYFIIPLNKYVDKVLAIIQSIDDKYGLYDVIAMKNIIPVQYDSLEWNDERHLSLRATREEKIIFFNNKGTILE